MKKLVLILLITSGCATIHEQCINPSTAAKYKDYDQCYAEKSASKEHRRQAFSHMGDGLMSSKTMTCTTWGNQTSCQQ